MWFECVLKSNEEAKCNVMIRERTPKTRVYHDVTWWNKVAQGDVLHQQEEDLVIQTETPDTTPWKHTHEQNYKLPWDSPVT